MFSSTLATHKFEPLTFLKNLLVALTLEGTENRRKTEIYRGFLAVLHHPLLNKPALLEYKLLHKDACFSDSYETGDDSINTGCSSNKLGIIIVLLA